jgi:hypothetical protein
MRQYLETDSSQVTRDHLTISYDAIRYSVCRSSNIITYPKNESNYPIKNKESYEKSSCKRCCDRDSNREDCKVNV